jgi:hypothetical protein
MLTHAPHAFDADASLHALPMMDLSGIRILPVAADDASGADASHVAAADEIAGFSPPS